MLLHHIGMLAKDLRAEAERLRGVCGYEIVSDEIEDKVQTAKVMFLKLPQTDSFLELAAPLGENSKLARALKNGEKLHHLCFQTDDISADLKNFREKGFLILCEPVAAAAFKDRKIAWVMDSQKNLFELVESGSGELPLKV